MSFPNALPGQSISIQKVIDGDKTELVSSSPYIKTTADLIMFENREYELHRKNTGAMSNTIFFKYSEMKDTDKIDVRISLKYPPGIKYLDKTQYSQSELQASSLSIAQIQPITSIDSILKRHGLTSKGELQNSTFITACSKKDLEAIMFDPDIVSIDPFVQETPTQSGGNAGSLLSLSASAYNHNTSIVPGNAGTGIHASTFETGILPSWITCIGFYSGELGSVDSRTGSSAEHTEWTFRCLQRSAPGAILYHKS